MKNYIAIYVFCTIGSLNCAAQHRMSLYEEFGGENCCFSAMFDPGFWSLCDTNDNPAKLIHITYLLPPGCSGTPKFWFDNRTKPINDARSAYYSISGVPIGRYDGQLFDSCGGNISCFSQSDIDYEASVPSPFIITLTSNWNAVRDSIQTIVNVNCLSNWAGGNVHLRVALVQTNDFATPPGSNGETHFENIVQAMYPDPNGMAISGSWTASTTMNYYVNGKVPAWITPDSGAFIVAWIQEDDNKKIAQAAKTSPLPPESIPVAGRSNIGGPSIFPNPASDQATLSLDLYNDEDLNIFIFDAVGRQVYSSLRHLGKGAQNVVLPLTSLSTGSYIAKIQTLEGSVNLKLVVAR